MFGMLLNACTNCSNIFWPTGKKLAVVAVVSHGLFSFLPIVIETVFSTMSYFSTYLHSEYYSAVSIESIDCSIQKPVISKDEKPNTEYNI